MRKRSVGINVRVSVTEKRKMTLMAKRCGLSLSEYLRQRALGYEPGTLLFTHHISQAIESVAATDSVFVFMGATERLRQSLVLPMKR